MSRIEQGETQGFSLRSLTNKIDRLCRIQEEIAVVVPDFGGQPVTLEIKRPEPEAYYLKIDDELGITEFRMMATQLVNNRVIVSRTEFDSMITYTRELSVEDLREDGYEDYLYLTILDEIVDEP